VRKIRLRYIKCTYNLVTTRSTINLKKEIDTLYLQAELELVVLRGLGLLPRLQLQGGQEHVLKPEPEYFELGEHRPLYSFSVSSTKFKGHCYPLPPIGVGLIYIHAHFFICNKPEQNLVLPTSQYLH
jgi:hypothetical protein